jgi:hypothetical protein
MVYSQNAYIPTFIAKYQCYELTKVSCQSRMFDEGGCKYLHELEFHILVFLESLLPAGSAALMLLNL